MSPSFSSSSASECVFSFISAQKQLSVQKLLWDKTYFTPSSFIMGVFGFQPTLATPQHAAPPKRLMLLGLCKSIVGHAQRQDNALISFFSLNLWRRIWTPNLRVHRTCGFGEMYVACNQTSHALCATYTDMAVSLRIMEVSLRMAYLFRRIGNICTPASMLYFVFF